MLRDIARGRLNRRTMSAFVSYQSSISAREDCLFRKRRGSPRSSSWSLTGLWLHGRRGRCDCQQPVGDRCEAWEGARMPAAKLPKPVRTTDTSSRVENVGNSDASLIEPVSHNYLCCPDVRDCDDRFPGMKYLGDELAMMCLYCLRRSC